MGGCALTRNITNLFNSNDTEEASLTLDGINATSVCCGFLQNLTSGEIPTAWPKDCNTTNVLHNGMKFAVNGNDCSSNPCEIQSTGGANRTVYGYPTDCCASMQNSSLMVPASCKKVDSWCVEYPPFLQSEALTSEEMTLESVVI